MKSFRFSAHISRRCPDPVFGGQSERHVLFSRAVDLPPGVPNDPNPRGATRQVLDRQVYKTVRKSLDNEEGELNTFHLKNKGITILAQSVEKLTDGEFEVALDDGHGVVDGFRTYSIIQESIKSGTCPNTQFVKVEILTGISPALVDEIAGGLNTSMQVQTKSLADMRQQFNWIRETLAATGLQDLVAYRESDEGKPYEIREILAFLTMFNIDLYPNQFAEYPITAYTSKEKTLDKYLEDEEGIGGKEPRRSFRKLQPILPDILRLAEIISSEASQKHTRINKGHGGNLSFVDVRKRGQHEFPFIKVSGSHRLHDGALYPTLGAFRYLVTEDKTTGTFGWRNKAGFAGVREIWDQAAGELMQALQSTNEDLGRNVNAMGKSRNLWSTLYLIVKSKALESLQG